MKYCIMVDEFSFNPRKYETIEQAHWDQEQNESRFMKVFDELKDAEEYLDACSDVYYQEFSYSLGRAKIYKIVECEYYYEDQYYVDMEVEKGFDDLELFDDVKFKAAEEYFKQCRNR